MTADELFQDANGHFVEESFEEASLLYDQAIQLDPTKSNYYLYRATNYIKMENYLGALADCDKYESSLSAFEKAKQNGSKCDSWILKSKNELKREEKLSGLEHPYSNLPRG